jgi:anti-sigma factor RsiW
MSAQTHCLDREKIFRCLHHLLEPAEEAAVRRHLSECAGCREIEASYLRLDTLLEEWKGLEPSASFDARLRQAIEARRRAPRLGMFFTRPVTRAFAAALVVVFMVAGTFMLHHFRSRNSAAPAGGEPAASVKSASAPALENSSQSKLTADEELKMYENLPVLENYDLLTNFDVLSELAPENKN